MLLFAAYLLHVHCQPSFYNKITYIYVILLLERERERTISKSKLQKSFPTIIFTNTHATIEKILNVHFFAFLFAHFSASFCVSGISI